MNLIDARTDRQVWSDRFDRRGSSLLALRSDVAGAVARELQIELSVETQQALADTHVVNEEAYDAYLRGVALFRGFGKLPERLAALETAVELDPDFAEAWSALAAARLFDVYARRVGFTPTRGVVC